MRRNKLEDEEMEPRLEKQELLVCDLSRSGERGAVADVSAGTGKGIIDDTHGENFGVRFFNGPVRRFFCPENKQAPSPGPRYIDSGRAINAVTAVVLAAVALPSDRLLVGFK